jgi:hypothetical protein
MALFVSPDVKLVAVHAKGWTTNAAVLDTNQWNQVTVKMLNGKFDVLVDDVALPSLSGLDLISGSGNVLAAASFSGTGLVDELYVSHGDPAYAVTGPTGAIPALPPDGDNPPTDEQQTRINVWLDGQDAVTSLGSMTQDQLSQAYLIGELAVDEGTASAVSYAFGISKIDLVSPTQLVVELQLTSDNGPKSGAINGRVQLQGKSTLAGAWQDLSGAVTPSYADFTGGKASYTFTIPAGGYQFFRPMIVP